MTTPSLRPRTLRLSSCLLAAALALAGCGTDDNTSAATTSVEAANCATGAISGAGSTFVQNITQQWVKDYVGSCTGANINYQGVGSGAGVQQFTSGTIDFAGSDVPLKPEELTAAQAKHGEVLQLPWSAGAIAVEYNLPGVTDLQLAPETIAGLFAGTITTWDDAAVKADNPGVALPSTPVQVVHRSDGSGTTAAFTAYLAATAPNVWKAGSAKDIAWPTGQGAKGSDGVTGAVKATAGAVGYAELSYAKATGLGAAKVKNAAGAFVPADSPNGVPAALNEAKVTGDLGIEINYAPKNPQAYPISTVTYAIVPATPADAGKARLLESFLTYALGAGQNAATSLQYAPLPATLADPARAAASRVSTG